MINAPKWEEVSPDSPVQVLRQIRDVPASRVDWGVQGQYLHCVYRGVVTLFASALGASHHQQGPCIRIMLYVGQAMREDIWDIMGQYRAWLKVEPQVW